MNQAKVVGIRPLGTSPARKLINNIPFKEGHQPLPLGAVVQSMPQTLEWSISLILMEYDLEAHPQQSNTAVALRLLALLARQLEEAV